jgi:hypothetical protein
MPSPPRITFDSNVWRPVVRPDDFLTEASLSSFRAIHDAIKLGTASGYLSESIFTLEAIKKKDRQVYFANHRAKIETTTSSHPAGVIQTNFAIGPDPAQAVKNNEYLNRYLEAARKLNFKLLRCGRIGGVQNLDLAATDYAPDDRALFHDRNEKTGECSRQIEARNCGIAFMKELGRKYSGVGHWLEGIRKAPDSEENAISKAVAEWADGDSVAAHVGYQNEIICTRDMAGASGATSIFSMPNRKWLKDMYGVIIVQPEELVAVLTAASAAP